VRCYHSGRCKVLRSGRTARHHRSPTCIRARSLNVGPAKVPKARGPGRVFVSLEVEPRPNSNTTQKAKTKAQTTQVSAG
jgi:hypothetical protein